MSNQKIQNIIAKLPKSPGIYKMKNAEEQVLYVGKAKNLANRVRSYFQNSAKHSTKTHKMISQIEDIDLVVVDSELEALILETQLIKELRPKYNILMKDDKNYVYIKVTTNEDFPRVEIVRKLEKDGAKYFGPKTSANRTLHTLKTLKKLFPYRHCHLNIKFLPDVTIDQDNKLTFKKRVTVSNLTIGIPCLDYHIKRCIGPCIGIPTPEEYKRIIDQVVRFLEGKTDEVIKSIKREMLEAAQTKKYELAARLRDKLQAVESIIEKQKISDPNQTNTDIINFITKDDKAFFNVFLIRDGILTDQEIFIIDLPDSNSVKEAPSPREILQSFLQQYYDKAANIGNEVLIPEEIKEQTMFEQYLSQIKGSRVKIIIPQKGKKNKLLELAKKNASLQHAAKTSWEKEEENNETALKQLQNNLQLQSFPYRIECFDISHFAGNFTVASMVVFENGKPKSKDYRQFKIRTLPNQKIDDYAAIKEALTRRLQNLSKTSSIPPNLTFGKAKKKEEKAIEAILKEANLDSQDPNYRQFFVFRNKKGHIVSLAKARTHNTKKKPIEEISSLWVDKSARGQNLGINLIKLIIRKTKTERIYLSTRGSLEEYFTNIGFRIIYRIPEELNKAKDSLCKTICNINPIYMVYEKKQKTDSSFSKKPDLIVIDGGKGQLSTADKVLKELKLENLGLASIAKREEEIFIRDLKTPLLIDKSSHSQKILIHARDEAHRFANSYREKLQTKNMTTSALDHVEGIGPATRKKLLKEFGSISGIKSASFEQLTTICGPKIAERLISNLP